MSLKSQEKNNNCANWAGGRNFEEQGNDKDNYANWVGGRLGWNLASLMDYHLLN